MSATTNPRPSDPAGNREARLRRLRIFWADGLRIPLSEVTEHTDLFANGADSMDLLYLETRIEATFRITLPDHAAIEAPTPGEMLDLVEEVLERGGKHALPEASNLTLRVSTGMPGVPPLFVAPGAAGKYVANVAWLARHLGARRGVTGLVSLVPPISARSDPDAWFAYVCDTWIAGIRAECPEGPWRLMAICLGAPYLWEVGRILSREGEVSLFFLDPFYGKPELAWTDEQASDAVMLDIRSRIVSKRLPKPADLDLTLLLTPNWEHRPLAEKYAELAPRTSTVRSLSLPDQSHGLSARTIAPVSAEVQIWLAARDAAHAASTGTPA
jgi:acyl carrier protein